MRIKEFFFIAFLILLVGSIVLELLNAYGVLDMLVEPLAPSPRAGWGFRP